MLDGTISGDNWGQYRQTHILVTLGALVAGSVAAILTLLSRKPDNTGLIIILKTTNAPNQYGCKGYTIFEWHRSELTNTHTRTHICVPVSRSRKWESHGGIITTKNTTDIDKYRRYTALGWQHWKLIRRNNHPQAVCIMLCQCSGSEADEPAQHMKGHTRTKCSFICNSSSFCGNSPTKCTKLKESWPKFYTYMSCREQYPFPQIYPDFWHMTSPRRQVSFGRISLAVNLMRTLYQNSNFCVIKIQI